MVNIYESFGKGLNRIESAIHNKSNYNCIEMSDSYEVPVPIIGGIMETRSLRLFFSLFWINVQSSQFTI